MICWGNQSVRHQRRWGDEIVEAARVCIGVDFPNLASAALTRLMEQFTHRHAHRRGIRLLVTFVRANFEATFERWSA